MIYTALCVRYLMRPDTLRGEVGGGEVALETSSFLGPKFHRGSFLPQPLSNDLLVYIQWAQKVYAVRKVYAAWKVYAATLV
jgi:hypothetical protein